MDGPTGKRVIIPDPEIAPIIVELYERFVTGELSIRELVAKLRG